MVDVTDWNDLAAITDDDSGTYTLQNDLDSTTAGYDTHAGPSANGGAGWEPPAQFNGLLDGNGFVIRDLFIDRPTESFIGLIDWIGGGSGGSVIDLGIEDADITADGQTGILAGQVWLTGGEGVTRCYTTGVVNGNLETGGVAGEIRNGNTVSECYSEATVNGGDRAGGFAGVIRDAGTLVTDCYSTGDVDGPTDDAGGFAGQIRDADLVDKCYTVAASVTGGSSTGGFVGALQNGGGATNSFWDETVSNLSTSPDGTAKTTTEMQDINTYTDTATTGLSSAWDMVTVSSHTTETWKIDDGNAYPDLGWETTATTSVSESGATSATATPSATETATASESAAVTGTATPTATETAGATESASTSATATPSATETGSFAESGTASATATPRATETASADESAAASASASPAAAETVGFAESGAAVATASPAATETASADESAAAAATATPTASETAPAVESAAASATATPAATETGTASESAQASATATPSATEAAAASESASVATTATPSVIETDAFIESAAVTTTATPTATEAGTAAESAAVTATGTPTATETGTAEESATVTTTATPSATETDTVTGEIQAFVDAIAHLDELIRVVDINGPRRK